MSTDDLPILGITMGDAAGVGPEVTVMALMKDEVRSKARVVVIGDASIIADAARIVGCELPVRVIEEIRPDEIDHSAVWVLDLKNRPLDGLERGKVDAANGKAAFEYVDRAVTLALANTIDAIVTAPLNKEAMHLGGYKYPGHTEALGHLCDIGEDDITMLLASPRLRVSHVSTHCSMLEAVQSVTTDRVVRVARLTAEAVAPLVDRPPKIALAGINPHSGENGLFGSEDEREIRPAAALLQQEGIDAYGPIPGDTVFLRALKGDFDAVVAMYHDQGHIPSKLAGFDDTVNITLGLPIIRTSVDHGTAFDIAGTGTAQAVNMVVAIDLAAGMGRARRAARHR
ncbi:MAG TPA: 4-hydroxythreonine-4-phosphate dehydrogenase PdxA [Chloroflexota bacterium]|nr:4-hydroxythreonine-4-phosphate dehydrogenase PdxA [Chloroflexota bacterium]